MTLAINTNILATSLLDVCKLHVLFATWFNTKHPWLLWEVARSTLQLWEDDLCALSCVRKLSTFLNAPIPQPYYVATGDLDIC